MHKVHAYSKSLNLWYEKKQILFDINLDIRRKEVTALIGPSGCGKSTFLRCFNRMNDFIQNCKTTGNLVIEDIEINSSDVNVVLLRTKVGMVFQKPNPFPKSIYDNVSYGPRLHGLSYNKKKLDDIVEDSLRKVGLWEELCDRLKDNALKLSGGQQQRLCIARAIAVKPTMLLMDEPCSALDPIATNIIENLITDLKNKFTIIIITHSMKQARNLSDNIAFFDNGRIIESSSTEEIFYNPKMNKTKEYIESHL